MKLVRDVAGLSFLRSSAVFALSGAAFALGTLLLARVMPMKAFGELSLLLALFNIFCLLAPAGIDQIVVRHRLAPSTRLLAMVTASGAVLGLLVCASVSFLANADIWDAVAVGLSIWVGGLVVVASGLFRANGALGAAAWIFTGGNWGLLFIGIIGQWVAMPTPGIPFALFVAGQAAIAIAAWMILLVRRPDDNAPRTPVAWREAATLMGMAAVATTALQLERIIIPPLIGLAPLALFSVLASVAIFPFRIVTAGLEFSLTPRLRAEANPIRRRALFRRELVVIAAALGMATLVILLMAPWAAQWFTGARYHLPLSLVLAACLNGAVKFLQTIPRSVLTACGSAQDLAFLNATGWIGLVLAVLGGLIGSVRGLEGIILGISIGTFIGIVPAFMRIRPALGA